MAVYDDVVNRINYWSNPDKYYGGIAMGSTSWRDNARVWDERAATVANFRTPPVPAPSTPTGLTITNAGSSFGSPNIDWNNNPESNINGYEVWRQQKRIIDGYTFPFSWLANTTSSAYTDLTLFFGSTNDDQYRYAVKAVDSNGNKSGLSNSTVWISGFGFLKVRPNKEAPETFALNNNYPNPFNPATTISVELPEAAVVSLRVFNVMGQQVAQLANGNYPAGYHQVTFDASKLSSGLYIARFEATGASGQLFSRDIKMQLIK